MGIFFTFKSHIYYVIENICKIRVFIDTYRNVYVSDREFIPILINLSYESVVVICNKYCMLHIWKIKQVILISTTYLYYSS